MLTDRVHIQVWDLSPRTAAPYLKGAAGAGLAQPGDAVQIVGGDGLILLLDETEHGEVEAGLMALSVFQHRGQLIDEAPDSQRGTSWRAHSCRRMKKNPVRGFSDLRDKQIKEGGVGGLWVDRGVASVQENKVPVEKEWGLWRWVKHSRSLVGSSNFAIYQDGLPHWTWIAQTTQIQQRKWHRTLKAGLGLIYSHAVFQ